MESQICYRVNFQKSTHTPRAGASHPKSRNSREPRQNEQPSWQQRVLNTNKNSLTIFHNKSRSTLNKSVDRSPILAQSGVDLRGDLASKQKYLQQLIEKIVTNEQQHKRQIQKLDNDYGEQIDELHSMLREAIEHNKMLQHKVEQSSEKESQSRDSMLLGDLK